MALRTLTDVAHKAEAGIRVVMDFNADALPFRMPPQIAKGLSTVQTISDEFDLGLTVPTSEQIQDEALTRYRAILGDLRRPNESALKSALGETERAVKVLESIGWLIG